MQGPDIVDELIDLGRDELATIRKVPLFASLDDHDLAAINEQLVDVVVEAGRRLTVEGAVGHDFAVIGEGLASVIREGVEVERLGTGAFFGEHALLHDALRTADVVALTPMRLLVGGHGVFDQLVSTYPQIRDQFLQADRERQGG